MLGRYGMLEFSVFYIWYDSKILPLLRASIELHVLTLAARSNALLLLAMSVFY